MNQIVKILDLKQMNSVVHIPMHNKEKPKRVCGFSEIHTIINAGTP